MAQLNEWLSINKTSGTGNAEITLTASSYEELVDRTTSLKIQGISTNSILTIKQNALVPNASVKYYSLNLDFPNRSTTNIITSNVEWYAVYNDEFISLNKTSGGVGETEITIWVSSYEQNGGSHKVSIYSKNGDIFLTQFVVYTENIDETADVRVYLVKNSRTNNSKLEVRGSDFFYRLDNGDKWYYCNDLIGRMYFEDGLPHIIDIKKADNVVTFDNCDIYRLDILNNAAERNVPVYVNVCSFLTEVNIPTNYKSILTIDKNNMIEKLIIPQQARIKSCSGWKCLKEVVIYNPDFLSGKAAFFKDCPSLKKVSFPNGVTKINDSSFENCGCLETVDLGDANILTYIGVNAFNGTALRSFTIPSTVTTLHSHSFSNCPYLETINNEAKKELGIAWCPNFTNDDNSVNYIVGDGCDKYGSRDYGETYYANLGRTEYAYTYTDSYTYNHNNKKGDILFTNKGGLKTIDVSSELKDYNYSYYEISHPWWTTIKFENEQLTIFLDPNYCGELDGKIMFYLSYLQSGVGCFHYDIKQEGFCEDSYRTSDNVIFYLKNYANSNLGTFNTANIKRYRVGLGDWVDVSDKSSFDASRGDSVNWGGSFTNNKNSPHAARVEFELKDKTIFPETFYDKKGLLLIMPNTIDNIETYRNGHKLHMTASYTILPNKNISTWNGFSFNWNGGAYKVPDGITKAYFTVYTTIKGVDLNNVEVLGGYMDVIKWSNVKEVDCGYMQQMSEIPPSVQKFSCYSSGFSLDFVRPFYFKENIEVVGDSKMNIFWNGGKETEVLITETFDIFNILKIDSGEVGTVQHNVLVVPYWDETLKNSDIGKVEFILTFDDIEAVKQLYQ